MANSLANLLLEITGDAGDARRELRQISDDVIKFGRLRGTAEVGVDGATKVVTELEALQARIDALHGRDIPVDIDVDRVSQRLTVLKQKLTDALEGGDQSHISRVAAGVVRDVERIGGSLEHVFSDVGRNSNFLDRGLRRIGHGLQAFVADPLQSLEAVGSAAFDALAKGASSLASTLISGLGSALTSVIGGVVSMAASAAPFVALIAVATPLVLALAASLVSATAAVGALGLAFVGLLGPIGLVVVGAFVRLASIFKQVTMTGQQVTDQAHQIADAQYNQQQAVQNLALAHQQLGQAVHDAYVAQRDAALGLVEANQQLKDSEMGVSDAVLAELNAQNALEQFRQKFVGSKERFAKLQKLYAKTGYDPTQLTKVFRQAGVTGVTYQDELSFAGLESQARQTKQGVPEAKTRVQASRNAVADAQYTADRFARMGRMAYQPYAAAVRNAASAQHALAESTYALAKARKAVMTGADGDPLSASDQALVRRLRSLKERVQDVMRPITQGVVNGLSRLIGSVTTVLSNRRLQTALAQVGKALGGMIAAFGQFFAQRSTQDAFIKFAQTAASVLEKATPYLVEFAGALLNLARAALPKLVGLLRGVGHALDGFSRRHDFKDSKTDVDNWMQSLKAVGNFVGALFNVFAAAFAPLKSSGDGLFQSMADGLNRLATYLRNNPHVMTDWFNWSLKAVKDVIKAIGWLIQAAKDVVSYVRGTLIPAFSAVYGAIHRNFIDPTKKAIDLIASLFSGDHGGGKSGGIGGVGALKGPLGDVKSLVGHIVDGFKYINDKLGGFPAATVTWLGILAVVARKWQIIGAPVRALGRLLANSGSLGRLGSVLGRVLGGGGGATAALDASAGLLSRAGEALLLAAERLGFRGPGGTPVAGGPTERPGGGAKAPPEETFGSGKGFRAPVESPVVAEPVAEPVGGMGAAGAAGLAAAFLLPSLLSKVFPSGKILGYPLLGGDVVPMPSKPTGLAKTLSSPGGANQYAGQVAQLAAAGDAGGLQKLYDQLHQLNESAPGGPGARALDQMQRRLGAIIAQLPQIKAGTDEVHTGLQNIALHSTGFDRAQRDLRFLRGEQAKYAGDTSAAGAVIRTAIQGEIDKLSQTRGGQKALAQESGRTTRKMVNDAGTVASAWRHAHGIIAKVGVVLAHIPDLAAKGFTSLVKLLGTPKGGAQVGKVLGQGLPGILGAAVNALGDAVGANKPKTVTFTTAQLKRWQNLVGLSPDGVIGPATRAREKQLGIHIRKKGHAQGGIATRTTDFDAGSVFGEAGAEALLPLRDDVLARLGHAIAAAAVLPVTHPGLRRSALAGVSPGGRGGGDGSRTVNLDVTLPPAPPAAVPDARYQASQLGMLLKQRGLGDLP